MGFGLDLVPSAYIRVPNKGTHYIGCTRRDPNGTRWICDQSLGREGLRGCISSVERWAIWRVSVQERFGACHTQGKPGFLQGGGVEAFRDMRRSGIPEQSEPFIHHSYLVVTRA